MIKTPTSADTAAHHGKSISIGNRLSIIDSFNMDMRSVYLDTELMLVIDSEAVDKQLKGYLQMYEAASVKVLDKDNFEISENVIQQEISAKNKWLINRLCQRF